jgi:hypothetical protein
MAAQSTHRPHPRRTVSSRFACWPLMSNARMAASTAAPASELHVELNFTERKAFLPSSQ